MPIKQKNKANTTIPDKQDLIAIAMVLFSSLHFSPVYESLAVILQASFGEAMDTQAAFSQTQPEIDTVSHKLETVSKMICFEVFYTEATEWFFKYHVRGGSRNSRNSRKRGPKKLRRERILPPPPPPHVPTIRKIHVCKSRLPGASICVVRSSQPFPISIYS